MSRCETGGGGMRNVAEAVVETLLAHGLTTLYALPGVHNDPLFDAVFATEGRLRLIHPRHEQAAGYMALGAALATGQPQAFAVVPGPGLLNAAAALLTASATGAPVLALVGQIPLAAIDRGYGHLHELRDQLGLLRHLTKFQARLTHPASAPRLLAQALQVAMTPPTGPVAIECPIDVWPRRGEVSPPAPLPIPPLPPPQAAIEEAAHLLAAATAPLIMAGGGAWEAAPELRALAERLGAPVMTFRRGRGVIPTDHPLAIPLPVGHRLWQKTDVLLAVGTRAHLPFSVWGVDAALKIVHIDAEAAALERHGPPDIGICADSKEALAALLAALPPHPRPVRPDLLEAKAWFETVLRQDLGPQYAFLRAIRAALPEEAIVVEDVTQIGFVGRLAFPVSAPRRYLSPGFQDNLGWGFGAALGAKAACPKQPVVALLGDGGFLYQAAELATAVRHHLGVVAVVFDDGAFGNVRRIQKESYGNRLIGSDLHNPDFVHFAGSFGVRAWQAADPPALEAALREALAENAPAVIHVPVGEFPSPWPFILLPRVRGREGRHPRPWP
jgi:acetolactate synthase-1/2/3 large subunit